ELVALLFDGVDHLDARISEQVAQCVGIVDMDRTADIVAGGLAHPPDLSFSSWRSDGGGLSMLFEEERSLLGCGQVERGTRVPPQDRGAVSLVRVSSRHDTGHLAGAGVEPPRR